MACDSGCADVCVHLFAECPPPPQVTHRMIAPTSALCLYTIYSMHTHAYSMRMRALCARARALAPLHPSSSIRVVL